MKNSSQIDIAHENMSLADFIRQNLEPIIQEWITFAKTRTPASDGMTTLTLRDHVEEILNFIADDLESFQTDFEQVEKSHGEAPKEGGNEDSAAETHAALRLAGGFDIDQMVSEYRALRASVVKLWRAKNKNLSDEDFDNLTRFHEAVDQVMTESITHYTRKIADSRNMFLGILGHDLRNPLGAILMSGQLMGLRGQLNPKQTILAAQIVESTERATEIITSLLDLTITGLGSGLPVVRELMDMSAVSKQLVAEMQAQYPQKKIFLETTGDMHGDWDKTRIGQVFSNLIGNAVQYSSSESAIHVFVKREFEAVILSVHNEGIPIPRDHIGKIFDALDRGAERRTESSNLGLGLYITKQIILAHGGTISVTSTQEEGTTFIATLPRHSSEKISKNIEEENTNT